MIAPATLNNSQWNHPSKASTMISGLELGVFSSQPYTESVEILTVVKLSKSFSPNSVESRFAPSAAATRVRSTAPISMKKNSVYISNNSSRSRLMSTVSMCHRSSPRLTLLKASSLPSAN